MFQEYQALLHLMGFQVIRVVAEIPDLPFYISVRTEDTGQTEEMGQTPVIPKEVETEMISMSL